MTGPAELLIRAGTIYTASGADPVLRDGWLRVVDGRIAELAGGEPPAPGRATRIDAPTATLLPGLIDCHVHFSLSGGPDWLAEARAPYALACWRAARHALATLRAGFTTVRTLGGRDGLEIALRDAQAACLVEAPRISAANLVVCITGGHASWIGLEADGPDAVRKAVRQQLKAGADCIKLIATGGVMTPGMEAGAQQLTDEELRAGVEEAHRAGKRVASHAHGADGVRAAVLAGVDSVEHGSYLTDEVLAAMRERGTFLSATHAAISGIAAAPPDGAPGWARAKAERVAAAHADSFRRAHQAGVRLVLGTDAGTPRNEHGANARELALMVQHGLDPLEALGAATRNGAELLGLLDEVGSLEPGKQADLVLCEGDATREPERLCQPRNIRAVIQAGRIVHQPVP